MRFAILLFITLDAFAQKPGIHGPKIHGVRPGNPVLYRIPATGARPMRFEAKGLPAGLSIDSAQGILSGTIARAGTYPVTLRVSNAEGTAERKFKIVAGDTIALTPPMGWSTWYMSYENISDGLVKKQTEAMVSSGLADHGYTYINLDDGWNIKPGSTDPRRNGPARDPNGRLRTNADFPDMKGLVDFVHARGLKAGIYISPGPLTCAKYEGSWQHEEPDLKQFVEWGFDFLKYDWCSYTRVAPDKTLATYQKPYILMGGLVKKAPRDIVFNLCQYGMGDVHEWGKTVGGNYWRTTGDISLGSTKTSTFWSSVDKIGFGQAGKEKWAGPGGWNDPDNILIGEVLVGQTLGPTPLTRDEQKTYFSLWCMLSAPLVLGSDLTKLDAETLAVLTNDEAIDINQDELGRQAAPLVKEGSLEVWTKPLSDGATAVAMFNRGEVPAKMSYAFAGSRRVRDLWQHKDLGNFDGSYETVVARHGVVLLRVR